MTDHSEKKRRSADLAASLRAITSTKTGNEPVREWKKQREVNEIAVKVAANNARLREDDIQALKDILNIRFE